ncbi:helix-turn-helix domain-containing protein [Comamonas aquatica]|uniref:helix-turn-helix domain-containing protein n=1 Tax=Comamonas aquatica TaxID=225991 RepID=UPI0021B10483|nr:helix-turn-helix transcriptional regulator [Comamonas aquatica]
MPNPLHRWQYETFREMLVVARKAAGLTQVEVAQRLDKPQSFVSKYEHGERRLDFTEFVELADILSIDVGRFSEEYRQQLVDAQARNG